MPVTIYVQVDKDNREIPPVHTHESLAAINMIAALWMAYQHQPVQYSIGINLHRPSADFVVVSERGIGVIDLKATRGTISGLPSTNWYANDRGLIKAGEKDNRPRLNPQFQVQDYAEQLRGKLRKLEQNAETFFIDTFVCFTHPSTVIEEGLASNYPFRSETERVKFTIIKPHEIVEKVYGLSFEAEKPHGNRYQPYSLTPKQIEAFMTGRHYLGLAVSKEIPNLMPTGEPYAWLVEMKHNQIVAPHPLAQEAIDIGREPSCLISFPPYDDDYEYVSRRHARITHRLGDKHIFIEDTGSSFGTYLNGDTEKPIGGRRLLKWNDQITLGGATEGPGVCLLKLVKEKPVIPGTAITPWRRPK